MSWEDILKIWGEPKKYQFKNLEKAKGMAHTFAFHYPHVVRELGGIFTVMMEKDKSSSVEQEFGPIVWKTTR